MPADNMAFPPAQSHESILTRYVTYCNMCRERGSLRGQSLIEGTDPSMAYSSGIRAPCRTRCRRTGAARGGVFTRQSRRGEFRIDGSGRFMV